MKNKAEKATLTYEDALSHLLGLMGSHVTVSIGAAAERPFVHVTIIGKLKNAETTGPTEPCETVYIELEEELEVPIAAIDFDRTTFRGATLEPDGAVACTFGELTYWIAAA